MKTIIISAFLFTLVSCGSGEPKNQFTNEQLTSEEVDSINSACVIKSKVDSVEITYTPIDTTKK